MKASRTASATLSLSFPVERRAEQQPVEDGPQHQLVDDPEVAAGTQVAAGDALYVLLYAQVKIHANLENHR